MDSIVDRKLNDEEKNFICHMTNKKLHSKKSTISEQQLKFKKQLAFELIKEQGLPKRLEQLNEELERRLQEYEQIVAEEKILMNIFMSSCSSSTSTDTEAVESESKQTQNVPIKTTTTTLKTTTTKTSTKPPHDIQPPDAQQPPPQPTLVFNQTRTSQAQQQQHIHHPQINLPSS